MGVKRKLEQTVVERYKYTHDDNANLRGAIEGGFVTVNHDSAEGNVRIHFPASLIPQLCDLLTEMRVNPPPGNSAH